MDKREVKTLNAINEAFTRLVNRKKYEAITIQHILDEAHISRSTFYQHYKTKDELLLSVCNHIFDHIFSHALAKEHSHDFSHASFIDFKQVITHLFYHIKDEQELFVGLFKSDAINILLDEFRKKLSGYALNTYYDAYPQKDFIPLSLKKDIAAESLIIVLKYWVNNGFKETPEEIAEYYLFVI